MQSWLDTMRESLLHQLTLALKASIVHNRSSLPPFRLPQVAQQILAGLRTFWDSDNLAAAVELGEQLAFQGLGLRSLLTAQRALLRKVLAEDGPGEEAGADRLAKVHDYLVALADGVAAGETRILTRQRDEMQVALERVIQDREGELRRVIHELSTPIMPVFDQILVLPLVGEIDSERASRIMERLLEEVVARRATVVIIDITGVPTVDAQTATALVRTAQSVQLLGARAVLVGLRPDIAKTLAQLGANLEGIITHANLQRGVEYALRLKGLSVQQNAPAPVRGRKP